MMNHPAKTIFSIHKYKDKAALYLLFFTMFLVMAGFGIITPFFPFLAKEMGANSFDLGLMVASFSFAQVVAAPFWGRVSDRVGRKPVLVIGLIGYAFSYYLLIIAPNLAILMLSRLLGGLLSASTFPAAQAYLVDITSDETRGESMSYMAGASNLGFVLGPAMGGIFLGLGIRTAFAIGGSLILFTGVLARIFLPAIGVRKDAAIQRQMVDFSETWKVIFSRNSSLLWISMLISFGSITIYSILGYYIIEKYAAFSNNAVIIYTLIGGVSVILQLFFIGSWLKRFGEHILVIYSLILGASGFIGLIYSPNIYIVYACVSIIAASLAISRPAILVALSRTTRLGQGFTMGLQGAFDGFGRVVGPLWCGWIYGIAITLPYWSSVAAFCAAAGLQMIAFRNKGSPPIPINDETLA